MAARVSRKATSLARSDGEREEGEGVEEDDDDSEDEDDEEEGVGRAMGDCICMRNLTFSAAMRASIERALTA